MTEYCKYANREGDCPTRSAAIALNNYHTDVVGATTALNAFDVVYCRNEGKNCPVRIHLDDCRKI